jgi:general secretion pathway protein G
MRNHGGFTLIELIVTVAILAILASAAMPMLKVSVQRSKESELRANLRQIRDALDAYKKAYDEGHIELRSLEKSGYPPSLEILVEGVEDKLDPNKRKIRFMRKIPRDPMLSQEDFSSGQKSDFWGLRSYSSPQQHPIYSGDVYDVYSLSKNIGTNGIPYAQW